MPVAHGDCQVLSKYLGGDFLTKLRKESGDLEEFDEAKLKASLTKAGASED